MRGDFQKRVYENFNTNLMFIDSSTSMERFGKYISLYSILVISRYGASYGALPISTIEVKNIMTEGYLPLRAALKFAWPNGGSIHNLVYEKSAIIFEEKLGKIREDYSAYTKFISKLDTNLKIKEECSHANRRNIKILIEIPSNFPFFKGPKTLDLV